MSRVKVDGLQMATYGLLNWLFQGRSTSLPNESIARRSGGHRELIQAGGIFFQDSSDVVAAIEKISRAYATYQANIPTFSLSHAADQYIEFIKKLSPRIRLTPLTTVKINYLNLRATVTGIL